MRKPLNNNGNLSGGSAEVCVPLKGDCCASGCAITPLGDGAVCERCWSDPEAYYDGPITADLSGLDPNDTAAFWTEALTTDRATLRTRWPAYKGKVPDALARDK